MQVTGKINPLSSSPSNLNSVQREPELCSALNVKIYKFLFILLKSGLNKKHYFMDHL